MTQPVKFGLNVDPNTGGLPSAERITAIADANGLDLVGVQELSLQRRLHRHPRPDHLAAGDGRDVYRAPQWPTPAWPPPARRHGGAFL